MALRRTPKPAEPDIDLDDDMPLEPGEYDIDTSPELPEELVEEAAPEPVQNEPAQSHLVPEDFPEEYDSVPATQSEPDHNPNAVPMDFTPRDRGQEILAVRSKVSEVITLIRMKEVPNSSMQYLLETLRQHLPAEFEEDFDVREELQTQLSLIRAVRRHIMNEEGGIKETAAVSEVKSILDASMKLSEMLNKANKDLINQERMQAIEASFMEVIETLPEAQQKDCLALLERRFKAQKALQK